MLSTPKHISKRLLTLLTLAVVAAGCAANPAPSGGSASLPPTESKTLTIITHSSFALSDATIAKFKSDSGYDVKFVAPGDAGTVVNQLVLTKDSPLADAVYGIDNTFAARATEAGVLSDYASPALPPSAAQFSAGTASSLTPIDYGDVCLNADTAWFKNKGLAAPVTFDDLLKPEYKDLLVVANPATSSPGLAFLLATIAAKGNPGYLDYWKALKANGLKVVKGWTEAYTVEFSGSSGKGSRPLVLSYASSPAYEPATEALTQTCFRQVEYAGVIAGAQNEIGARKFVDFLLSEKVQAQIPEQMYMYPVDSRVKLPTDWAKNAAKVEHPFNLAPAEIEANRDGWIKAWTAAVVG